MCQLKPNRILSHWGDVQQPYITKAYFGMKNPPVKLGGIAIGDGAIGSFQESTLMPIVYAFPRSALNIT